MITEILTHIQDAKKRLIQQYKGKPNTESLLEAFVQEFQNLESLGKQLNEMRSVNTATGNTLDRLGSVVGQRRLPGQSDDDYRVLVKSKISQNVSQGEPERLIEVYKTLNTTTLVILEENFPASVSFESDHVFADQAEVNMLLEILEKTAAAAVRIEFLVQFDTGEPFAFAGTLSGLGFGTTADAAVGGKLSKVWSYLQPFSFAGDNPRDRGFGSIRDPLVGGGFFT